MGAGHMGSLGDSYVPSLKEIMCLFNSTAVLSAQLCCGEAHIGQVACSRICVEKRLQRLQQWNTLRAFVLCTSFLVL